MRLDRETIKAAAPFLTPLARGWHRRLTAWRSRDAYVSRHAPFLKPDTFDQVFFDNRGNHPTQHVRTTRRLTRIDGADVLVLGCRSGAEALLWLRLGARSVTGLDYNPRTDAWQRLRERGQAMRFLVADARRLPFADSAFDIVSSESLLEHVRHPGKAIDEMHRVVRPGGLVYSIFGPLYFTAGGAHYEGTYEHLLMDRAAFLDWIAARDRAIEREECLTYYESDMFSYWTADQYLHEFEKHAVLHSAVFLSPEARRVQRERPDIWARLLALHPERDLLISGLAVWSRR